MEQLAIAVTGCVAIWLANDQREGWRKWASVFGLAGQPFWFYSAFVAEQWGILAMTFVYTAAWARGFRNNWMRSNPPIIGKIAMNGSIRTDGDEETQVHG